MKPIAAERTASRQHQRAAPIAQFPFLNHGTAIKPQPGRLLDKADVNRGAEEGGGDSECVETGPHRFALLTRDRWLTLNAT
jgi:hypothetical protein